MCFIDNQDVVETFLTHGSDPTFGDGSSITCLNGSGMTLICWNSNTLSKAVVYLLSLSRIKQQNCELEESSSPNELASLLSHPPAIWIGCHASEMNPSGSTFQRVLPLFLMDTSKPRISWSSKIADNRRSLTSINFACLLSEKSNRNPPSTRI